MVGAYGQMFRLDGRRALVIGAGNGIGAAVAEGLAAFGASVVCADLDEAAAAAVAGPLGEQASSAHVDVTDGESVRALATAVGSVDVVVSTVGVNVRKRLADYRREEFDRVVSTNLGGTFEVVRTFGPAMAERGSGSIIAFSSIRAQTVEPGQGVYAATKAAMVQLLRTAAAELGPQGVRVNAVAPGVVETPLTRPIKDDPAWYQAYADKSVLRRWAQPAELVGAVVYLASDASSYVTGSVLVVDGGWTAADGRFDPPA